MRNLFKALCGVVCTVCLCFGAASCELGGGKPSGGGGGGGGGQTFVPQIEVNYDEATGEIHVENLGDATFIVSLNGVEYTVTTGTFFVNDYVTQAGEYNVRFYVLVDGQISQEQSFIYRKEADKGTECEVTFNDENGGLIKRIFVEKGYEVTAADYPMLPTAEGVSYAWSRQAGFTVMDRAEINLVATYTQYTLTYELNGGTMLSTEYATSYTVQSEVYLPVASREGYLFAGWYTSADFSGNAITFVGGRGNTGNKTLYAKWSEITADAQELLTAMETTAKVKTATVSYDGYEQAIDISSGAYAHVKSSDGVVSVITGGYYYDYSEKTRYAYTRVPKIEEYIPLEGVYGNLSEIVFEKNEGGEKSFLVKLKGDNEAQLRIKIKDGKLSYIGLKDGSEYYNIGYTVNKISPKADEFEEKKKIFILGMLDGQRNGEWEVFVKSGQNLSELEGVESIWQDTSMPKKGFYLDEAGTQPVTTTDEVVGEVYFHYYSMEYVRKNTQVILRHTCQCDECNGETTDYRVSMSEYEGYVQENFASLDGHFKDLLDGFSIVIGDGYRFSGPYMRSDGKIEEFGKEEWMMPFEYYLIEETIFRALEQGQPYENLVVELRSTKESIPTKKLTLHIGGESIEKYFDVSSGQFTGDHFVYEYIPEGKVYLGWYLDEAMTQEAMPEVNLEEVSEVYARVEEDTRKEITIHFGGVAGQFIFHVNYYAQGQHTSKDEMPEPAKTQTVKFFKEEVLKALQNGSVSYIDDGTMDGYQIAGYFKDEACTQSITGNTTTDGLTDIYIKWGKTVSYTLHFVDGVTENGTAVEGAPLAPLVENFWIEGRYTEEYRSVKKFYTDEGRTKETTLVVAGDIFVGYEEYPTLTLICPSECTAGTHTFQLNSSYFDESWFYEEGLCGMHGFIVPNTEEFNKCEFYTDEACTKPIYELNKDGQYYIESDMTLYAKTEQAKRTLTVHCGCLTHGETGVQVTVYTETQLGEHIKNTCDFGKYVGNKNYYKDAERKEWLDWWNSEGVKDIWLQKFTSVTLYLQGEGEKTILVTSLYEVVYFYEEEQTWSDGEMKEEIADPATQPQWTLFTDSSYTTPRILNTEHKLTEGEKFYFKKSTISGGYYEMTIDGGEYGQKAIRCSFAPLVNMIIGVDDSLFADSGKLVEGYYYDEACTELAMKRGQSYYFNQPITLYAKLMEMPKMTVHFMQDGYDNEQVIDLPTLQSYHNYIWRFVNFEYLFEEGYMYELCKNADGSEVISLSDIAEEGEYYFVKNEYAKNNIKVTLPKVTSYGNYVFNSWQIVGQGDYFYLSKGASMQTLLKVLHNFQGEMVIDNGQRFAFRDLIQSRYEVGEENFIKQNIFKIYKDEGLTQELLDTATLTADTALYFSLDVSGMKMLTVYLEDKGVFKAYKADFGMQSDYELFSYLCGYKMEVPWSVYEQYPTLFTYGAICGVYTDREMTKLYEGWGEESVLYANLETLYTVVLKNPIYGGDIVAYAGVEKKTMNDLRPELFANPNGYGLEKVGYLPYLASDAEGNNEVSMTEELNGRYYICYRRDPSLVEVTVGSYEGAPFDPECDFWVNGADGEGSDGMPTRLGTMAKFYLKKGESLEVFIEAVKNIAAVWYDDGTGNVTLMYPEVTIYTDEARTQELTDLTVSGDTTIYVTVVPWELEV